MLQEMPSEIYILVLAFFSSLSLSLPTPQTSNPDAPPVPASLIQCTPIPPMRLYLPPPTFRTCAIALRSLPSTQDMATFHASGPADEFLLPVSKTYGTCTVQVELGGGHPEETSSWVQIGMAATQLSMACVDTNDVPRCMGGRTTAGAGNWIVITVRESGGALTPWRNGSFVEG